MKKTFQLNVDNKKPERQADSIKHEVKKYLTRERKKETPVNVDFWDFDCRIGDTTTNAETVKTEEINKIISMYVVEEKASFYLEIIAKPGFKTPKVKPQPKQE